jgi:chromosomal replication initiator protein
MVDDEKDECMKEWDEFLQKMEESLGAKAIHEWVKPIRTIRFDARNLYLESDNPLEITWFEEHIRPHLKRGLFNNNGKAIQVHLQIKKDSSKTIPDTPKSTYAISSDRLDPEHTFDNFLTSKENLVAYKLLSMPNLEFNPIYIFGSKHTGKTHLLTASALALQAKGKKVFYVRAETFASHVVQSIRLGQMVQFRNSYRNIDALFVDGVEFFAKKDATQEEFFHTFNVLHTSGKQIVLSASCPPSKLLEIEQRLMSRFEWGISMEIKPVDPLKILEKKSDLWNASYSPELLLYLANTFPKDPLLALQALLFRTKGMRSLTPEKAQEFLQDLIAKEEVIALSPEKIVEKTANHFGLRLEDVLGKGQAREFTYPRQIAMFLCREKLKLPFQKIGEIFGRDHSTVMSSVRHIQKNCDEKNSLVLDDLKKINP